jgi:hypothetical protein
VANYAADGGCLDNGAWWPSPCVVCGAIPPQPSVDLVEVIARFQPLISRRAACADDGSSYYHIHHNFCVFGGHKGDFDGNKKISSDNIHAFPSVYGTTCVNIGAQSLPPKGYAEGYFNNKCILPTADAPYLKLGGISGPERGTVAEWPPNRAKLACLTGARGGPEFAAFNDGITLGNNTLYVPGGAPKITCGTTTVSFAEFQAKGYDLSSKMVGSLPSNDTIIAWAKELLLGFD